MDNLREFTGLSVPVQNRFEIFTERENGECTNVNNVNISREDFVQSSLDNKLVHMFDELRFIRSDQVKNSLAITKFHQNLNEVNEKLNQVIHVANNQTDFMKTLAYKSIDQDARSRRNNLVFRGFMESPGENCAQIIRDFIQNRLALNSHHMYIARAHRFGKTIGRRPHQSRPIIVNFRDYGDTELIMGNVRMLKGTPFSVDFDFPREIQEARGRLWPRFKELKGQFPRSRVRIVYPAKLVHDGRIVCDELPDWNRYVSANRLATLSQMGPIKAQHVAGDQQQSSSNSLVMQSLTPAEETTQSNVKTVPCRKQLVHNDQTSDNIMDHETSATPINNQLPTQQTNVVTEIQPRSQPETAPPTPVDLSGVEGSDPIFLEPTSIQVQPLAQVSVSPALGDQREGESVQNINVNDLSHVSSSEETRVKSVLSDQANPVLCAAEDSGPIRGRTHKSRSETRSQKRSQSSVPYRRNSKSKTRGDSTRVLPAPKNRNSCSSSQGQQAEGGQPPTTGFPNTQPSVNNQGKSCTNTDGN